MVLGANREQIEPELQGKEVGSVFNSEWPTGMGSSIATGLAYLLQHAPSIHQVLILVGDQPLLQVDNLTALVELQKPNSSALGCFPIHRCIGAFQLCLRKLFLQNWSHCTVPKGRRLLIQKTPASGVDTRFFRKVHWIWTPRRNGLLFLTKIKAQE